MNLKIKSEEKTVIEKKCLTIALEVFPLSEECLTGIGYTAKNIVEHLMKIDVANRYFLYFKDKNPHINLPNQQWNEISIGFRHFFEKKSFFYHQLKNKKNKTIIGKYIFYYLICKFLTTLYDIYLPLHLNKIKADIYIGFSHNYLPPFFFKKKIKKGVFLYDTVWKLFPETMVWSNKIKTVISEIYNLPRTDFLLSISNNTRNDFLKFCQYKKDIYIVHLAADSEIFRPASGQYIESVKIKYNTGDKYILIVGTIEPRKNLTTLLKAFANISNQNLKLVFTGKKGWLNDDFFSLLDSLNIRDKVIFTGYTTVDELAALYSGAKAFVFPSIYEGFGLPLLEAMGCGCPVIASNCSSIPEITEDAAMLFNPNNHQELAQCINKMMEDENLRNDYIQKGFIQFQKFHWEKSAQEIIKIINSEADK